MSFFRQMASAPLAWFALQAAILAGLTLAFERPLSQDAPRLLAIERVRRSLAAEGESSPFHAGIELAEVAYERPFSVWMRLAEPMAGERLALRLFMAATTLLLAGGLAWMALALRPSRRWALAGLAVPLLFHRSHYMGFLDYNLGFAALPWALGGALRIQKAGGAKSVPGWAAVLGAAVVSAVCSPLAAVPLATMLGALAVSRPRGAKVAGGLLAAAALAPALAGAMMFAGGTDGPKTGFAAWPSTINAITYALDCWDPAGGPAKAPFLLGILGAVFALLGGRGLSERLEGRKALPLARRASGWARSMGGPQARGLLLAAGALAFACVALPSRLSAIDFITFRMFPAVAFGAAFALPARRGGIDKPMLAVSAATLVAATAWLHWLADRDQSSLAKAGAEMSPGAWVMILPPPVVEPPMFEYLSPWFDLDETAPLDAVTGAGALTSSLYIPAGTFPIRYRPGAAPLMWQAGSAKRWRENDLAAAMAACDAVWFVGLLPEASSRLSGGALAEKSLAGGANWSLWTKPLGVPPGT